MRPQRRHVLTAGLLSGAAGGLLMLAPQLTSAAEPLADLVPQAPPSTDPAANDEGGGDEAGDDADGDDEGAGRSRHLRDALQPLVDEGTITEEQVEDVIDALESAVPGGIWLPGPTIGHVIPGFPGRVGPPDFVFPAVPGFPGDREIFAEGPGIAPAVGIPLNPFAMDVIANAIGIDASDLLTQLSEGSTVAEIASANDVDPQTVIDAVLEDVQEWLEAAVASGRLTEEEADERLVNTTERITDWVGGNDDTTEATETTETTEPTETTETTGTSA